MIKKNILALKQALDTITDRYTVFMALIPMGLYHTNPKGEVLEANAKYYEITGLGEEELKRRKWIDHIYPQDRDKVMAEWARADKGKDFFCLEYRYCHPQKDIIWLSVLATTLKDATGRVLGYIGTIEDVTDKYCEKQKQLRLKDKMVQMNRLSTVWSVMSNLSHELNQPLSVISTYAQECLRLIKLRQIDRKNLLHIMSEINRHTWRASSIVHSTRMFCKYHRLAKERITVCKLFSSVLQLINQDPQKNVVFEMDFEDEKYELHLDKLKMEQVILNIIQNSLEAIQNTDDKPMVIRITTREVGDWFCINISDIGPGMTDEVKSKCFHSFFTTKTDGMGVGLAICQSIVEAHDGQICVDTENQEGTKICIQLPIAHNIVNQEKR